MKSKSFNDLDFLSNDLRRRRYLSRKTFLVYLVMFLVACVDETRKKSIIYRHEFVQFQLPRNTHLGRQRTIKAHYFKLKSRGLYPLLLTFVSNLMQWEYL